MSQTGNYLNDHLFQQFSNFVASGPFLQRIVVDMVYKQIKSSYSGGCWLGEYRASLAPLSAMPLRGPWETAQASDSSTECGMKTPDSGHFTDE